MEAFLQKQRVKNILNLLYFMIPILGVLFVFREVVFQGKIFSHLDVLITFVPYYDFLSNGVSLVSQNILSGFPVYVSTNSGWFNPFNKLIFNFLDPVDTFRFLNITYILLAYVFSYFFMRRIHIGHLPAIFGATVFIFAGQVMLWSETIIITNYYFLMPLSLLVLDVAVASKPLKSFFLYILLGVLFGWGWVSGHVQFLIYVHTLAAVYFVFLLWNKHKGEDPRKKLIQDTCFFAGTLLISFFLGLPQISAILDFLPLTARATGVTLDAATAYAYAPHHLIYYLLPFFKVPYLSVSQSFQNYIGILPLLIFSFSFFIWRDLKKNKYFSFFFWVFVFCFTASIKYSPLAYILHQLPLYSSFRETFRIMFIGDFALGIITAISISSMWENSEVISIKMAKALKWLQRIFLYLLLPFVLIVSFIKVFYFESIEGYLKNYFLTNLYKDTIGGLPLEHYYGIISRYLHQSIDQFYVFDLGMLVLLVFGVLSFYLLKNIKKLSFNLFLVLAIFITVANFSFLYINRIQGITKDELVSSPKTAEFIKEREYGSKPYRIFSPLMSTTIYNESTRCSFDDLGNWDISQEEFLLRRELIEPNLTILYDLESADGYEPYVPVRNSEILGYIGSRFSTTDNNSLDGEKISLEEKILKLSERKNVIKALNIKYVLTTFQVNDSDFKLVYSDVIGECESKIYVYELEGTFPRYFLTNRVSLISPQESLVAKMKKMELFTVPSVLIESEDLLPTSKDNFYKEITPTLNIGDIREFSVEVKTATYLLIGETQLPGWEATVDGVKTPLIRANYIYSAIYLLEGKHNVRLEYKR